MGIHNTTGTAARIRPTSFGGLFIVCASAIVSALSYGTLAETVRIRFTVDTHYRYGPKHASTLAVLVAFPIALLGLYVGFRWLGRTLAGVDESAELRLLLDATTLAVFAAVLVAQCLIVALNLWL
ncbi:hypothetical protein [Natronorubrum tibetense]|uniref:Uncharacterized protein n=1 Tax=Natronorubrum tibetense GA33 TaxID=1114856 RepID=L9VS90_9EURY|nr:hypothetical protein [Natronorubrum tibetense]ELY40004.1 hypothetical protein C496_12654 [Natronorubrum tibetense GA33]